MLASDATVLDRTPRPADQAPRAMATRLGKRLDRRVSPQVLVRLLVHRPTCRSMPARGGRCPGVRRDGALHPLSVVLAWRVMSVVFAPCLPPQAVPIPPFGRDASSAGPSRCSRERQGPKSVSANAYSPACFEQHAPVRNVLRKLARLDVGVGLGTPCARANSPSRRPSTRRRPHAEEPSRSLDTAAPSPHGVARPER